MKTSVKIDTSKLLGYRIVTRQAIGSKVGAKAISSKIGAKIGAKIG